MWTLGIEPRASASAL
jgi:hypothetical protein